MLKERKGAGTGKDPPGRPDERAARRGPMAQAAADSIGLGCRRLLPKYQVRVAIAPATVVAMSVGTRNLEVVIRQ